MSLTPSATGTAAPDPPRRRWSRPTPTFRQPDQVTRGTIGAVVTSRPTPTSTVRLPPRTPDGVARGSGPASCPTHPVPGRGVDGVSGSWPSARRWTVGSRSWPTSGRQDVEAGERTGAAAASRPSLAARPRRRGGRGDGQGPPGQLDVGRRPASWKRHRSGLPDRRPDGSQAWTRTGWRSAGVVATGKRLAWPWDAGIRACQVNCGLDAATRLRVDLGGRLTAGPGSPTSGRSRAGA